MAAAARLSVANPNLYLAVNVSPRQLAQANLAGTLSRVLRSNNFDANQLIVDLSEAALIEPSSSVADSLRQLKRLGVRLAVDDFGTGSSSLSSLHRLPIDIVKIHNSLISELGTTSGRASVLRAAVSMAQALGLASMAEGVETDEQLAELRSLGVGFAQGHRFSTALDEAGVAALLRNRTRW